MRADRPLVEQQGPVNVSPPSHKTQRVEKFRALVDENYKKHYPVTVYAGLLGITPGQLSRLCREVLGLSGRVFRKHAGLSPREFRAKALSAMLGGGAGQSVNAQTQGAVHG